MTRKPRRPKPDIAVATLPQLPAVIPMGLPPEQVPLKGDVHRHGRLIVV